MLSLPANRETRQTAVEGPKLHLPCSCAASACVEPMDRRSCPAGNPWIPPNSKRGHPFRWRGSKTAGFMLYDVKITNTDSKRDLLYLVGHQSFPGWVSPTVAPGHLLAGGANAYETAGQGGLIGTDDLRLTATAHERAAVITEAGYRYEVLDYAGFSQRYAYLLQKEMAQARGLAFIPYVGGFVSMAARHGAARQQPKRMIRAQEMVLRPGVVPAGSMVRGYLVFGWPHDIEPGGLTLRLPVQPGHAASVRFEVVRRD